MAIVYVAGIISGLILVTIALAGWVGSARKKLEGGEGNHAPARHARTAGDTYTGATTLESYRADRRRRRPGTAPNAA